MTGTRQPWSLRLFVVCFSVTAVSAPIAWVSIAKLLLALVLLYEIARNVGSRQRAAPWQTLAVARYLPWLVVALFVSLLWTPADTETALQSVIKHSKLIFMLVPVLLIRSLAEAQVAMRAFAVGQIFLLLSSWLVFAGVPLPWVIYSGGKNAVFSTYLDQSMILASSAAIFWHLRAAGIWPRWLALVCSAAALANVLFLLEGRTGYVLIVALTGLAAAWACPVRWRRVLYGATAVLVLATVAWAYLLAQQSATGPQGSARAYSLPGQVLSSDGWRLTAWSHSLQAIGQAPLIGSGAGSWKLAIQPFAGDRFTADFGTSPISNPHQEFLLWAVEFGLLGAAALVLCLLLAARDARRFEPGVAQALWSLLAACAIAGLFNSVLYDDSIGDFFCIVTGLLLALGLHSPNLKAKTL